MVNNQHDRILFIVLPLIVVVCLVLWVMKISTVFKDTASVNGIYDLRTVDFLKTNIRFPKTVDYVLGELLTPEEFARAGNVQTGTVPGSAEVLTMRATLLLPSGQTYGFYGKAPNYASSIYINGEWLCDVGTPAEVRQAEKASDNHLFFSATPVNGKIEIVCQTSCFSFRSATGYFQWYVGTYSAIARLNDIRDYGDAVVGGWFILLALIYSFLALAFPGYRANRWLCALAVVWILRAGFTGTKPWLVVFSALSFNTAYRIELLAIPATFILFLLAYEQIYPQAFPPWLHTLTMAICGIWILVILFLPVKELSSLVVLILLTVAALAAVFITCLVRCLRRHPLDTVSRIHILGLTFVGAAFFWDILYHKLNVLPFSLLQPVLVVFSLFQLVAMLLANIHQLAHDQTMIALLKKEAKRREDIYKKLSPGNAIVKGRFALDTLTLQAYLDGEDLLLTPKEFSLLQYLLRHEGTLIDSEALFQEVWSIHSINENGTLRTTVYRLRKKLEGSGFTIVSNRRKGYTFMSQAELDRFDEI